MTQQRRGNDRLRQALHAARLRDKDVSDAVGVDPKTVQRWLAGRLPHPRHRWAVAELLGCDERELWPQLDGGTLVGSGQEILASYPQRGGVPQEVWRALFGDARREIGVLVNSGLFLAEDPVLLRTIVRRAEEGVRVRFMIGNPDSPCVTQWGAWDGRGPSVVDQVRAAVRLYRPLAACHGVQVRLHSTPLYNSVFRGDRDLLVNQHVHGVAAAHAPVLHLRRPQADLPRGAMDLVRVYLESFETVWASAAPLTATYRDNGARSS